MRENDKILAGVGEKHWESCSRFPSMWALLNEDSGPLGKGQELQEKEDNCTAEGSQFARYLAKPLRGYIR